MSTLKVDNIADRNGAGQIPMNTVSQGTAKAWFNLNGTGTISPRDTFNITSFTDNGTGDYTSTFTIVMPNANFSVSYGAFRNPSTGQSAFLESQITASCRNAFVLSGASFQDTAIICAQIIGDPS